MQATVHGVAESQTRLSNINFTRVTYILFRPFSFFFFFSIDGVFSSWHLEALYLEELLTLCRIVAPA